MLSSHPQGKNIENEEFNAIGDMLSSAKWELPQAQEYKNDLVQPHFLALPAVPKAESNALSIVGRKPDPEGPCTEDQWTKVLKMGA